MANQTVWVVGHLGLDDGEIPAIYGIKNLEAFTTEAAAEAQGKAWRIEYGDGEDCSNSFVLITAVQDRPDLDVTLNSAFQDRYDQIDALKRRVDQLRAWNNRLLAALEEVVESP